MKKTPSLLAHYLARHPCLGAALGLLVALAFGPHPTQAAVTEAWVRRYTHGSAGAVAVDGSGNVAVTGPSSGNGGNSDYYTAKYAAADGALLWEQRYNGLANSDDSGQAVALDRSGNVVVTGNSATIKYLGDGTWEYIDAPSPPGSAFYRTVQP